MPDASLTAEPRCPSHFCGVASCVKAAPTRHRGEQALGPRIELTQDSEKVSRTSRGIRDRATTPSLHKTEWDAGGGGPSPGSSGSP